MTRFEELQLVAPLLLALDEEGYAEPTPIQVKAIPHALAGKDIFGIAQTGTGKTAAFALPILQRLAAVAPPAPRKVRAIVLSPTRELASQIGDSFVAYGRHMPLLMATIYGGVGQGPQTRAITRGVDILVATPGRLLDLMGQGWVRLNTIETLVLDEADRMLDMGFVDDVYRIVAACPIRRQTMLFSATLPNEIKKLAKEIMHEPVHIEASPAATTVDKVEQRVYYLDNGKKGRLLERIVTDPTTARVLVFTRTKRGANRVAEELNRGPVRADVLHADRGQSARERTLANFRTGETRVVVATDIASRGLDVDGISHVVNYDVPHEPDVYVHRIGRTARAGAVGMAVTFCAPEERGMMADIEKLIRMKVPDAGNPSGPLKPPLRPMTIVPYVSPPPPAAGTPAAAHAAEQLAADASQPGYPATGFITGGAPSKVSKLRQRHPRRR